MQTALASRERSTSEEGESLSGVVAAFLAAAIGVAVLAHHFLPTPSIEHPEDAVVFSVSVAAVVVACWWAANVAAWTVALRSGRSLVRFTLPGSRRLAQLVLALWLSSACVAEPDPGPAMVLVETADETGSTSARSTAGETSTTTALDSTALDSTALADPAPAIESTTPTSLVENTRAADGAFTSPPIERPPTSGAPNPDEHGEGPAEVVIPAHQVVVSPGDNLWSLSADALALHSLADPDTPTIARYWRLVVAGNDVRSGDADIIVPGETINLPAHTAQA